MRVAFGLVLVLSMAVASAAPQDAGPAAPDEPDDVDEPLEPKLVSVRGSLRGQVASFVVRYLVEVDGPTHDRQHVDLPLPDAGLVTGATVTRDGRARRLDLVPAERAEDAFDTLGHERAKGERRSAVLIARGRGSVALGIASPRPGQLTIELEIAAPTCFFADARQVRVPEEWVPIAPQALRDAVRAADAESPDPCGPSDTDASWLAFPSTELARRPSGERIGATAGRLAAGSVHLVRVEVDIATNLADIPRDLATAIVVDGSRSLDHDEREAQRALVAAYLERAGDTRVQVIAFSRDARALLPSWVPASRARASIDRELGALVPRNGSNLDRGLAEARAWLERVEGTRRIVVITDERMAQRLTALGPVGLGHEVPARALVHTVALTTGRDIFDRDDAVWLAPLAAATEGMSMLAGPPSAERALDVTRLLRPTSLDDVRVDGSGWSEDEMLDLASSCEGDLEEGDSCTWWARGDARSGPITIEGQVWGKRFRRILHPDRGHQRELARELSAHGGLEPELQARVDELARAVNTTWSLYAEWGGRAGYDHAGSSGVCGCASGTISGSSTSCAIGGVTGGVIARLDLKRQLEPVIAHCKLGGASATARVELTLHEIADVLVTIEPRPGMPEAEVRALHACITEAIWSAEPIVPQPVPHATHTVTLGR